MTITSFSCISERLFCLSASCGGERVAAQGLPPGTSAALAYQHCDRAAQPSVITQQSRTCAILEPYMCFEPRSPRYRYRVPLLLFASSRPFLFILVQYILPTPLKMKFVSLIALAALAPFASALDVSLYADPACTVPVGANYTVFNGVCTGFGGGPGIGGLTMKASCNSDTAVTVTTYNTTLSGNQPATCSSSQPMIGSTVTVNSTGCTPANGAYAKISASSTTGCSAPGPVYFFNIYNGANCLTADMGSYATILLNVCLNMGGPNSLMLTGSGSSLTLNYFLSSACTGTAAQAITGLNGNGVCANAPSAPISVKVWSTSGAATVVASLGAVLIAILAIFASSF